MNSCISVDVNVYLDTMRENMRLKEILIDKLNQKILDLEEENKRLKNKAIPSMKSLERSLKKLKQT